jgi:hypothetical protein
MKIVKYDSRKGKKLWLVIKMFGNYYITYTWDLWSSVKSEPPILTKSSRSGSNLSPHDDVFQVVNDYSPMEPLVNYNNRRADLNFWVKLRDDNTNYKLVVQVYQAEEVILDTNGNVYVVNGAQISSDDDLTIDRPDGIPNGNSIEEFLTIQLIDIA